MKNLENKPQIQQSRFQCCPRSDKETYHESKNNVELPAPVPSTSNEISMAVQTHGEYCLDLTIARHIFTEVLWHICYI